MAQCGILRNRERTEGGWGGPPPPAKEMRDGIEEGTCWDEHRVLYVSDESWESTPRTKSTLCILSVSQLDNKLYF